VILPEAKKAKQAAHSQPPPRGRWPMSESSDPSVMLLRSLQLPTMAAEYEAVMQRAEKEGWSHRQVLRHLCESEAVDRGERRTARLLAESGLPEGKTPGSLDEAEFAYHLKSGVQPVGPDLQGSAHHATMVVVDRLVHHSIILEFDGTSRRVAKAAGKASAREQWRHPHQTLRNHRPSCAGGSEKPPPGARHAALAPVGVLSVGSTSPRSN